MYKDPENQRAASKRHYEQNKEEYLARNARRRQRLRALILEAKSVPCMDCHRSFPPCAMDFDHRGDKEGTVSFLPNYLNLTRLLAEMAKCDVVCSNCHRKRTHERRLAGGGQSKAARHDDGSQPGLGL